MITCEGCLRSFEPLTHRHSRRFCSKNCKLRVWLKRQNTSCEKCGSAMPGKYKHDMKFCDICRPIQRRVQRVVREQRSCAVCVRAFMVVPSTKKECCGWRCSVLLRAQRYTGRKIVRRAQPKPNGLCITCGRQIAPSVHGGRLYCRHRCASVMARKYTHFWSGLEGPERAAMIQAASALKALNREWYLAVGGTSVPSNHPSMVRRKHGRSNSDQAVHPE